MLRQPLFLLCHNVMPFDKPSKLKGDLNDFDILLVRRQRSRLVGSGWYYVRTYSGNFLFEIASDNAPIRVKVGVLFFFARPTRMG